MEAIVKYSQQVKPFIYIGIGNLAILTITKANRSKL
jgi:hypothetical protein